MSKHSDRRERVRLGIVTSRERMGGMRVDQLTGRAVSVVKLNGLLNCDCAKCETLKKNYYILVHCRSQPLKVAAKVDMPLQQQHLAAPVLRTYNGR